MAEAGYFDLAALATAIERARVTSGVSWADLSRSVGVSVSTIKRFGHAADAEADGVLALVRWLGVAPEEFVRGACSGEPLARGEGMVRADLQAVATLSPRHRERSRMTIQDLVSIARRNNCSVASLTHTTDG